MAIAGLLHSIGELQVHRSERADALVDALGDVLSEGLPDPLETEVISVPTRGVERWLTQRLSGRLGTSPGRQDGVCANMSFPFPGRLIGAAVAAVSGVEHDTDPWLPERAVWPLLGLLDDCVGEPWLAMVAGHLGAGHLGAGHMVAGVGPADPGGPKRSRRFATARHITDLFDRYAVHRPAMLASWAAGADVDGAGRSLPDDSAWQAELWRRLRERTGTPGPAERLEAACTRLRADPSLAALPPRLSIFGLTRLPASYLDVLRSLAVHRDVHLFLLHPSPALWARIAGDPGRRRNDASFGVPRNPLLASWGRDACEMQLVLGEGDEASVDRHRPILTNPPETLLQRIQHAIRAEENPPGEPFPGDPEQRPILGPTDRSIQVHACHGRIRQIEVLRDALLHLLVDDPTLEARDIIVMCPDIETFAPLIHATFGAGESDDEDDPSGDREQPVDLRVRLADRSLRQTNPILATVWNLLALADARVTASQVLDFIGREPVRRRFRLDDDEVARIGEWVAATGIRWGLDGPHREPFRLEAVGQNTWRAGVDRVLVGGAMADENQRLVGGVLPLDDVDSGSIDLAGRFAELVNRLRSGLDALCGPAPITAWVDAIAGATDALATADSAWQRAQLQFLLDEVLAEATVDGRPSAAQLQLAEFRSLLADRLRGQPTRANFRTGHLTVCTLVPMRSVPHRVVCLLGLDDGAFPRRTERDGDDLILAERDIGDRDSRNEDLQLLLDAVLAATEYLVITYTGNDECTNVERPPAVPVGELLDVVDRTVRLDGTATPARERIVSHHPLQPFDVRNFTPGSLGVPGRPWSFDPVTLDGARALVAEQVRPKPFLSVALPPVRSEVIELDQLVRFVQHPVKAFLRQRLGMSLGDWSEEVDDALPVELDGLQAWGVGQRILDARLGGAGIDACIASELARGQLPPGEFSNAVVARIRSATDALVAAAPPSETPDSVEVNIRLDDGRLLVGTVAGVVGQVVRTVTFSRVGPKHRIAAWARYLALAVARPDRALDVVTIGRRRGDGSIGCQVTVATLAAAALASSSARRHLHDLVDLYDRGMCEPLPVYCATSAAYACAAGVGRNAHAAARSAWETGRHFPGEGAGPEHQLVLGGVASFDDLLVATPYEGEEGANWDVAESTRFGRYARRTWDGLLHTETVEDR